MTMPARVDVSGARPGAPQGRRGQMRSQHTATSDSSTKSSSELASAAVDPSVPAASMAARGQRLRPPPQDTPPRSRDDGARDSSGTTARSAVRGLPPCQPRRRTHRQ